MNNKLTKGRIIEDYARFESAGLLNFYRQGGGGGGGEERKEEPIGGNGRIGNGGGPEGEETAGNSPIR